jgi:hypothetical protein
MSRLAPPDAGVKARATEHPGAALLENPAAQRKAETSIFEWTF